VARAKRARHTDTGRAWYSSNVAHAANEPAQKASHAERSFGLFARASRVSANAPNAATPKSEWLANMSAYAR
jgi:hypothetical protein